MDSDSAGDENTRTADSEAAAETIAVLPQQPAPAAPLESAVTEVVAVAVTETTEAVAAAAPTEVVPVATAAPAEVVPVAAATEVVPVAPAPLDQAYAAAATELVPVAGAPLEQTLYPSGSYPAGPFDPAYAMAAPPSAPAKRNLMALLGVILAIPVWPVGLVLSTLGLLSAFTRKTGKVLAIVGLVLSVLTGGAVIAELAQATSTVSASTALDAGCKNFEAKLPADLATLKADTATLTSNIDSAATSNSSIQTISGDLTAIGSDLNNAAGEATHADVKSDLNKMITQLQSVSAMLSAIQNHSTSSEGAAAAALTTLAGTDTEIDSLCSSY